MGQKTDIKHDWLSLHGQMFLCCRPFELISKTWKVLQQNEDQCDVSHLLWSWQESIIRILIIIFNLMALLSVISSLCCIQVDYRRVGELSQILRQPGLSDPHRSLRAVPPRRNQPLGPQQVLQRREAREPAALQPSTLSCPVEDGGVVRGWASTPETCCWWHNFWMGPKIMAKVI